MPRLSSSKPALTVPPINASVITLPNGLEILVREDPAHPLVSVQVWIKAGSLQDDQL